MTEKLFTRTLKKITESRSVSWNSLLSQFFGHLKLRILANRQLLSFQTFFDKQCISHGDSDGVFCSIDLFTDLVSFNRQLEPSYYIKTSPTRVGEVPELSLTRLSECSF